MTDKIKAFFQKKKVNAKFMTAGKGYKLSETSTAASSTTKVNKQEPIKRAEPTQEAKIAGQAALARLEAKRPDPTKFNTSYAAIQARVKRELSLERKALKEETSTAPIAEPPREPIELEENPLLAVKGVYFRCPYISDEILSWNEWKVKIQEFLYEELKAEEPGLVSCLIIHNCNSGKEKIDNCIETLGKYLDNIIRNPEEEKYRKIRMCNRIFQEKVLPLEGTLEFLKAAGFEEKKIENKDGEMENFLVWNSDKSSIETLTILLEALKSAEAFPIEVDRNVQVLLPQEASQRNELPPDFFTLSIEEFKKEQRLRAEAFERNQMLRTKAMREKDEQRELRKYRFTLIRIRFPDNIMLQGTFGVREKFSEVLKFVRENLIVNDSSFVLTTPTGLKLKDDEGSDKTLAELRLVPAAILSFSWESEKDNSSGYLTEEVLCLVKSI